MSHKTSWQSQINMTFVVFLLHFPNLELIAGKYCLCDWRFKFGNQMVIVILKYLDFKLSQPDLKLTDR